MLHIALRCFIDRTFPYKNELVDEIVREAGGGKWRMTVRM
jgi:hypothetical protein